jgi:hypothetical protein
MRKENVVEHNYVWTINGRQSAYTHLSTALEGRYVVNSGKQLQSGAMKERRILEVCLL